MLVTAAVITVYNTGVGFLAGLVAAALLSIQRLGIKTWCHSFIDAVKLIPKNWVADRDYATGKMILPTSANIIGSTSTSSLASESESSSSPLPTNKKNKAPSVDHLDQVSTSLPQKSSNSHVDL